MSMTTDEAWEVLRSLDDETWRRLREAAVASMGTDPFGGGISSSDINHTAVALIRQGWLELDDEPSEGALERHAEQVGTPLWMRV